MRFAIAVLVVLLVAPQASARELWRAWIDAPIPDTPHIFHFGTSTTGFIDFPVGVNTLHDYTASDGPNVAALFAEMTNGVDDGLQFKTPAFEYNVPENHLFRVWTMPPVNGFSLSLDLLGPVDLQGFDIEYIRIIPLHTAGFSRYSMLVFGYVPEPSSLALLVLAVLGQLTLRLRPSY
jgi:hypothetical protein